MSPQYIAGLVDGEGYLGLIPHNHHPQIINAGYTPVVKVCLTGSAGKEVVEELRKLYGGSCDTRKKLTKGGRQAHTFHLRAKKTVGKFLSDILPYLKVKSSQAILLMEFCELPYEHPKSPNFDYNIVTRRTVIYHTLKQLKQPEPLATTE